MAEGVDNKAIGGTLYLSESGVSKHISSIFTKLGLPEEDGIHRRVMAVLTYLHHVT